MLFLCTLCFSNWTFNDKVVAASHFELIGDDIFFEIIEPEDLKFTYRTRPARNFGSSFNSSYFHGKTYLVPTVPERGCVPPKNADDIAGNIALVERGICSFITKAAIAQEAGAMAVIISDDIEAEDIFTDMIDDQTGKEVSIPTTFLLGKNGYMIRKTLRELEMNYAVIHIPVNVTFVSLNNWKQPPWLQW